MKLLATTLLLLSSFAFAQTTQQVLSDLDLWETSTEVMYELGANPRLNPVVLNVRIVDKLGDTIKVKFQYREDMYGKKTCTYVYDLEQDRVRNNSWLCGM